MKLLLLLFLTFACSAQKAEYDVINDFLEVELKDMKYDSIHIQIESLNNMDMLLLYEYAYNERNNTEKDLGRVWISRKVEDWPLDEKSLSKFRKNLKKNNENWKPGDFDNSNFVFKKRELLQSMNFRIDHFTKGTTEYGLALSKPIFTKNKKYALFTFSAFSLLMGGSSLPNLGTVVMKKENNKWIVLYSIREAVYN